MISFLATRRRCRVTDNIYPGIEIDFLFRVIFLPIFCFLHIFYHYGYFVTHYRQQIYYIISNYKAYTGSAISSNNKK